MRKKSIRFDNGKNQSDNLSLCQAGKELGRLLSMGAANVQSIGVTPTSNSLNIT